MDIEHLEEQLKTLHNLVDISFLIIEGNRPKLLPTILELILLEAQSIAEKHCIEEK